MGLVITKRVDEAFWVGDAKVVIMEVYSNRVMLRIEAPSSTKIRRTETRVDPDWQAPGFPPEVERKTKP